MRRGIQLPKSEHWPNYILHVLNTILYENEFQNPQIFQQTISLFPKQSILAPVRSRLESFCGFRRKSHTDT
jgi:hypothetical protein